VKEKEHLMEQQMKEKEHLMLSITARTLFTFSSSTAFMTKQQLKLTYGVKMGLKLTYDSDLNVHCTVLYIMEPLEDYVTVTTEYN